MSKIAEAREKHVRLNDIKKPIKNPNKEQAQSLTFIQKIAKRMTHHVGSIEFFIMIFLWTAFWLTWNTIMPPEMRFDPYPAFVLWLFISNMIQIFLMPLIMIGQNLESEHSEKRAELSYESIVRSEEEIDIILLMLEHQNDELDRIMEILRKNDIQ